MKYRECYEEGRRILAEAGIEEADLDARLLLEHVCHTNRNDLLVHGDRDVDNYQKKEYLQWIEKRSEHIPLQYLTGTQDFMGLTFKVSDKVLIPRQDTEVLVERVLEDLESGMQILDMCTGSGCILLSLLKLCAYHNVTGVGVDISEDALRVARQNAEKLDVNAQFLSSDLFEKVEGVYDIIVSNPPYIRTSVIEELKEEVKLHEPYFALDGKEDGLYFYRRIVQESSKYLKKGGKLYFEIGHDQGEDVSMLMKHAGFTDVIVKKDLAGLDRVVFGVYNV